MPQGTEVDRLFVSLGLDLSGMDRGLKKFDSTTRKLGRMTKRLGASMAATVTPAILGVAGASLKAAADFGKLRKSLETVMGGSEAARAELAQLQKVAAAPGIGLQQAVKASVRLQVVGQSAAEARDLIQQVGNAIAASGGTAEDLDEVTRQFSQILSLGKLTQENLGQITERAPGVAAALQKAFGTTVAEQINEQISGVDEFTAKLREALQEAPRVEGGLGNAFTNLRIKVTQSLATIGTELDEAFDIQGNVERLTSTISRITEGFQSLSDSTQSAIFKVSAAAAAAGPVLYGLGAAVSAIGGPLTVLAAGLTAAGVAIVDLALNWDKRVRQMKAAFLDFLVQPVLQGVDAITSTLAAFTADIPGVGAAFGAVAVKVREVLNGVNEDLRLTQEELLFTEAIAEGALDGQDFGLFLRTGEGANQIENFATRFAGAIDLVRQKLGELRQGRTQAPQISGSGSGQVPRPSQALGGLSGVQGALGGTQAIESGSLQSVGKLNERLARARFQLADMQAKSTVAFQVGLQGAQVFAQGLGRVVANTLTLQGGITSIGDAVKGLGNVFRSTLNSIISQLTAAIAKAAVFSALISAIPGLGSIGGATTFGGLFKGAIGLADGGIVTQPTFAMVGEGGESEAVIPLSKLPQMGGGLDERTLSKALSNINWRISGRDIVASYDETSSRNNRRGV
jgi:tape measure domain-containing protein